MGGGGAMRSAARILGIGATAGGGGIRGLPKAPPADHSVRNASGPMPATLTSSPPHMAKAANTEAVSWLDDWDLGSDNGELIMEGGEAMPRVVFGSAPSFQEAKAATSELKEAIDQIYLSSNSSEFGASSPGSQCSVVSPFHSELEAKSHVIEAIPATSLPKSALQAFQLLSTSHEVENVVASIACDPNVWNAVMQNSVLKDFIQPHQNIAAYEEKEGTREKVEELPDSDSRVGYADFMATMLKKVSLSVSEMLSSMSSYLQNIFGFSTEAGKSFDGADGSAGAKFTDYVPTGGFLMGLAMMVVMVVLLKRV